jgi:hypothetical protein
MIYISGQPANSLARSTVLQQPLRALSLATIAVAEDLLEWPFVQFASRFLLVEGSGFQPGLQSHQFANRRLVSTITTSPFSIRIDLGRIKVIDLANF